MSRYVMLLLHKAHQFETNRKTAIQIAQWAAQTEGTTVLLIDLDNDQMLDIDQHGVKDVNKA